MKKNIKRLIAVFLVVIFLTACDSSENKVHITSIHPENNDIVSICDSQKFTIESTEGSQLLWILDGKIVAQGSEYTYTVNPTISCSSNGFENNEHSSLFQFDRKKHYLFVVMFSKFVRDVKAWTITDSENCPAENQQETEEPTCDPMTENNDVEDVDNDCDKKIDSTDTQDCPVEDTTCEMVPEICDDGIDNDCDNLIDAMDTQDCPGDNEDDRSAADTSEDGKLTICAKGFDAAAGLNLTVLSYPAGTQFHPNLLRSDNDLFATNEGVLPAIILPDGTLEHRFSPTLPLNIMDDNYLDATLSEGDHLIIILIDHHPMIEKTATRADIGDNDLVANTVTTITGDTRMNINYHDLNWVRYNEIEENDSNSPTESTDCIPESEVCDDGSDNDCDGLVDDQDTEDCPVEAECQPVDEVCDDGSDNDCDGLVDEQDTEDCPVEAECQPVDEVCDDGIDNDCDGLVDDLDKNDCEPEPFCVPVDENCYDNIDNDCDGLIDNQDTENCPAAS